jgi:iron complex outermembrane receptor protein
MGGNWNWSIRKIEGNVGLQINNLFNKEYQVMPLRAMPGRNYQFNINIKI